MAVLENGNGKKFKDLVLGDAECAKLDVLTAIKGSSSFSLLHSEWRSVALHIGIEGHRIEQLSDGYINGVRIKSLPQLIDELLGIWKGDKGDQAKLTCLCEAFRSNRLTDIAQTLEAQFSVFFQDNLVIDDTIRQFQDMTIGDKDCTKFEVSAVIERAINFQRLRTEWKSVARCLGIEKHKIDQLSLDYISGVKVKTLKELLDQLLSLRNKNGNQTKIANLCEALESNGLIDISQALLSNLGNQDVIQDVEFEWQGKIITLHELLGDTTSEETYQTIKCALGKKYYSKPIQLIKEKLIPTKPSFYLQRQFTIFTSTEPNLNIFTSESSEDHEILFNGFKKEKLHSKDSDLVPQFVEEKEVIGEKEMTLKITSLPSPFAVSIADSSRTGKTLVLASLANRMRHEHPDHIVLFIILQDFVHTISFVDSTSSALEAIAEYSSSDTVSKLVLAEKLKNCTQKLFLYLDGYDEVPQNKFEQVDSFLKHLLNSVNIVVSVRPYLQKRLETMFNNLSYGIIPFDDLHQIKFLTNYWVDQYKATDGEQLKELGKYLLEELGVRMSDQEKEIAGIPLQCMMLAEVNAAKAKQISNSDTVLNGDATIPIKSLYKMYKRLVELKFSRIENLSLRRNYINAHVYEAIVLLFPDLVDSYKPLLNGCDKIDENTFYSIGLTEKLVTGNRPRFIHKTFAEYILAEWVVRNLNNGWEFLDLLFGEILGQEGIIMNKNENGKCVFQFRYPVIVYFLEVQLKKSNQQFCIDELFSKASGIFFRPSIVPEDLCMTILACCGSEECIFDFAWKLLMYFHKHPTREERKLQRSPLMYLMKICGDIDDQMLEIFYKEGANFNAEDNHGDSILFYVLTYSTSFSCVKTILRYGADVNHTNKKQQNSAHKVIESALSPQKMLDLLNLLESKFEFNQFNERDLDGLTPLDYALRRDLCNGTDLITFLKARSNS